MDGVLSGVPPPGKVSGKVIIFCVYRCESIVASGEVFKLL